MNSIPSAFHYLFHGIAARSKRGAEEERGFAGRFLYDLLDVTYLLLYGGERFFFQINVIP